MKIKHFTTVICGYPLAFVLGLMLMSGGLADGIRETPDELFDEAASCFAAIDAVISDIAAEHREFKGKYGREYEGAERARAVLHGTILNHHYWRLNELRERLAFREIGSVSILDDGYRAFRVKFKAKYMVSFESLKIGEGRYDVREAKKTITHCIKYLIPAMELELGKNRGS